MRKTLFHSTPDQKVEDKGVAKKQHQNYILHQDLVKLLAH